MQAIQSNVVEPGVRALSIAGQTQQRKTISILNTTLHYLEQGSGDPIVFLHGNPTSSYLWRNIIPLVADRGTCLAPDLVGMGNSGCPPHFGYRFLDHVRYLDAWFEALRLRNVTLVLHDWGSALGFYWAYRHPNKVKAIVYMEALVQPRFWSDFPNGRDAIFRALRSGKGEAMIFDENFFVETVLPKSILRTLSQEEMDAYRKPFQNRESRMATLAWARELPIENEPLDVAAIVDGYGQWLAETDIPKLMIVAEPGALLTGRSLKFCRTFKNQREVTVRGIHYLQEDSPLEIGEAVSAFVGGL